MNLKDKGNDTYDVEIISTGFPAGLSYGCDTVENFEYDGTDGKWTANEAQRNEYSEKFYIPTDDKNEGRIYSAAGLYYNFEKVIFKGTNNSNAGLNYGYFTKINEQSPTEMITGSIFRCEGIIKNKITGIRSVMLSDLTGKMDETMDYTEKSSGLFVLQNLGNVANAEAHKVSGYGSEWKCYWLASPNIQHSRGLNTVTLLGQIHHYTYGIDQDGFLRPVISISGVELTYNSETNVWQME